MATAIIATSSDGNVNSTSQQFGECIKTESDWVDTKCHNICTGEVHVVPTGLYDYAIGIPLVVLSGVLALFAIVALIKFTFDSY